MFRKGHFSKQSRSGAAILDNLPFRNALIFFSEAPENADIKYFIHSCH